MLCCFFPIYSYPQNHSCHSPVLAFSSFIFPFSDKYNKNTKYLRHDQGGMILMSLILISSYRLKEVTNSYVLHCLRTLKTCSYLCTATRFWVWWGFVKVSILDGQESGTKKSKLKICWHVTHFLWSYQKCKSYWCIDINVVTLLKTWHEHESTVHQLTGTATGGL